MSVTTNPPRGMNLPRPKPPIVPVTHENVSDWWVLFFKSKPYPPAGKPAPGNRATLPLST